MLNPQTGEVKLIDFGIATRLLRHTPACRTPALLERNVREILAGMEECGD